MVDPLASLKLRHARAHVVHVLLWVLVSGCAEWRRQPPMPYEQATSGLLPWEGAEQARPRRAARAPRRPGRERTSSPAAPMTPAVLARALTDFQQRVAPLIDRSDLVDSLYFGWFDRPYPRATLACVVKTLALLERELNLRREGNGALEDDLVAAVLSWLEGAIARAAVTPRQHDFLPDRFPIERAVYAQGAGAAPLFGFVDRATWTAYEEGLGDIEVLASCGLRVYARARGSGDGPSPLSAGRARQRMTALGLLPVVVGSAGDGADADVWQVCPRRLSDWIGQSSGRADDTDGASWALWIPPEGETRAESLARRGLYRGVTGGRPVVYGWRVPGSDSPDECSLAQLRAAMWVDAFEGTAIALLEGWRDFRDGSRLPYPSVTLRPGFIETVAYTALDFLRYASQGHRFDGAHAVAVLVDGSALDPGDPNRWSREFRSYASALLDRQISFDVLPRGGAGVEHAVARYELAVGLPLRASDAATTPREGEAYVRGEALDAGSLAPARATGQPPALFASWVDDLLSERATLPRIVAWNADGTRTTEVYVRATWDGTRLASVAVVNLSQRARRLTLRVVHGEEPGALVDLLSGGPAIAASQGLDLRPWQVSWLVRPGGQEAASRRR